MKSLKHVQIVAKVLKILSMIAFVSSIVACALCLIGIPVVAVLGDNQQIMQYVIDAGGKFDKYEALCACISGAVGCGFMIALYACVVRFYKRELQIGTPFNDEVVKKSRIIGWLHIILALSAAFVVGIICACFKVESPDWLVDSNVTIGIIYLLISFVFAYGRDVKNEADAKLEQKVEPVLVEAEVKQEEKVENAEPAVEVKKPSTRAKKPATNVEKLEAKSVKAVEKNKKSASTKKSTSSKNLNK